MTAPEPGLRNSHRPSSPKLMRIEAAIQRTEERRLLRLLNLAWWREYLHLRSTTTTTTTTEQRGDQR